MLYELRREACMKYEYHEAIPETSYIFYTTLGETEGGDGKQPKTVYLSKKA